MVIFYDPIRNCFEINSWQFGIQQHIAHLDEWFPRAFAVPCIRLCHKSASLMVKVTKRDQIFMFSTHFHSIVVVVCVDHVRIKRWCCVITRNNVDLWMFPSRHHTVIITTIKVGSFPVIFAISCVYSVALSFYFIIHKSHMSIVCMCGCARPFCLSRNSLRFLMVFKFGRHRLFGPCCVVWCGVVGACIAFLPFMCGAHTSKCWILWVVDATHKTAKPNTCQCSHICSWKEG